MIIILVIVVAICFAEPQDAINAAAPEPSIRHARNIMAVVRTNILDNLLDTTSTSNKNFLRRKRRADNRA